MTSLFETINNDLKSAMKEKRELDLLVLRMLIAALKNKQIELSGSKANELTETEIIAVIKTEIKKRKDSVTAYEDGKRIDLADKEKREILILEKYLPKQMSEQEIEKIVRDIAASSGIDSMQGFGQLMGQAMGKLKNQTDGNTVSIVVKKVLGGN